MSGGWGFWPLIIKVAIAMTGVKFLLKKRRRRL